MGESESEHQVGGAAILDLAPLVVAPAEAGGRIVKAHHQRQDLGLALGR